MRKRVPEIAIITLTITVVGVAAIGPKDSASATRSGESTSTIDTAKAAARTPVGFIDGSQDPELIPDQVAFSLLFRLISQHNTKEERERVRSYLKMSFGDGSCTNPIGRKEGKGSEDAYINALLAVGKEFNQRVGVLDRKAQEFHDRYWPNPSHEVLAQLNKLQSQKEEIVAELVASLPARLGASGMDKLRRHIDERVKRKTKWAQEHVHN